MPADEDLAVSVICVRGLFRLILGVPGPLIQLCETHNRGVQSLISKSIWTWIWTWISFFQNEISFGIQIMDFGCTTTAAFGSVGVSNTLFTARHDFYIGDLLCTT
jgi:hypothetical protein